MAIKITVIGARDKQLSEFLRIAGMQASAVPMREFDQFALSTSDVPDAVVIDLRGEVRVSCFSLCSLTQMLMWRQILGPQDSVS